MAIMQWSRINGAELEDVENWIGSKSFPLLASSEDIIGLLAEGAIGTNNADLIKGEH